MVLNVVNWVEKRAFWVAGWVVRAGTSLLARMLRRGRFRSWRRQA